MWHSFVFCFPATLPVTDKWMCKEYWQNDTDNEQLRFSEINLSQCHFFPSRHSTWIGQWWKAGLNGEISCKKEMKYNSLDMLWHSNKKLNKTFSSDSLDRSWTYISSGRHVTVIWFRRYLWVEWPTVGDGWSHYTDLQLTIFEHGTPAQTFFKSCS